jgi:phosphosulfolactate synthase
MDHNLKDIPKRESKERQKGLTMVMDKGLSIVDAESLIEVASDYTDLVKLGFGTSYFTKNTKAKIELYKQADIKTYLGGTLFEAYVARGQFDDYVRMLEQLDLEYAEVSDGSLEMEHDIKLEYIRKLKKYVTVISEVGSKKADVNIPDDQWVQMMKTELQEGAWKVIGEARESGTVGLFDAEGKANTNLIDNISEHLNIDDVIWEAPNKKQQVWFIKHFGANVNLGNIASGEVIALETLRTGLRGDTFFQFLSK